MYGNIGLQRYREADINSMTKEKLIVLLYEKIVSDLEEALVAHADDKPVAMIARVNHSQRIVSELRNALDHGVGGDVSRNLESIYDYLFHEHLQALVDRDPIHLTHCLTVLQPLLEAWRQVPAGAGDAAARDLVPTSANGPDPAQSVVEDQAGADRPGSAPPDSGALSISA